MIFLILFAAGWVGAAENPSTVKTLAPYQAESGMATQGEKDLVGGWLKALTAGGTKDPWLNQWLQTELRIAGNQKGSKTGKSQS